MGHVIDMPKSNHPLWMRWLMLRRRNALCEAWRDFATFVEGVSPKPAHANKLGRPSSNEPYGPGNFVWMEPLTGERKTTYHQAYNRKNYDRQRDVLFRKKYGMSLAEYDAELAAQGGVCAICGTVGSTKKGWGREDMRNLAVDHDHTTGSPRGLLCNGCNVGLGLFEDDPTLLSAAADYLRRRRFKVVS